MERGTSCMKICRLMLILLKRAFLELGRADFTEPRNTSLMKRSIEQGPSSNEHFFSLESIFVFTYWCSWFITIPHWLLYKIDTHINSECILFLACILTVSQIQTLFFFLSSSMCNTLHRMSSWELHWYFLYYMQANNHQGRSLHWANLVNLLCLCLLFYFLLFSS